MKNFTRILLFLGFCFSKLSLDIVKDVIDEICDGEDDNCHSRFSLINPIFGYLFESTGALNNIRFMGPDIQITYVEESWIRNYSIDQSSNPITALLIELFPSPSGALCHIRNKPNTFGFKFNSDKEKGIEFLADVFSKILLPGLKTNYRESLDCEEFQKVRELLMSECKCMFSENLQREIKLMAIQSFILNELETREELKYYLDLILYNAYDSMIEVYRFNCEVIDTVIQISERFTIFPYSELNQPPSNELIPIYDRANDTFIEDKKFSDCADVLLLNICNCLFYDPVNKRYDISTLNPNSDLSKFYSRNSELFTITNSIRKEWSKVVQGLSNFENIDKGECKLHSINYIKCKRNEIEPGIINMMNILIKICELDHDSFWSDFNGKNLKLKLVDLFSQISPGFSSQKVSLGIDSNNLQTHKFKKRVDFIGFFDIIFHQENKLYAKLTIEHRENHAAIILTDYKFFGKMERLEFANSEFPPLPVQVFRNYISICQNDFIPLQTVVDRLYFSGFLTTYNQKRAALEDLSFTLLKNIKNYSIDKCNKENDSIISAIKNILSTLDLNDLGTRAIFLPFLFWKENLQTEIIIDCWIRSFEITHLDIYKLWEVHLANLDCEMVELYMSLVPSNRVSIIFDTLRKFSLLKHIKIWELGAGIRDQVLTELGRMTNLTGFSLSNSPLEIFGSVKLARTLRKLPNLKELDLSDNSISFYGFHLLMEAIGSLENLTSLDIRNIDLDSQKCEKLASALLTLPNLLRLYLIGNEIDSDGFRILSNSLKKMKQLRTLDLSQNDFSLRSVGYLINTLAHLTNLRVLNLNKINIDKGGIRPLMEAISTLYNLVIFGYSNNILPDTNDFEYLSRAISNLIRLERLNLSSNHMSLKDLHLLEIRTKRLKFLNFLDLLNIEVSPEEQEQFEKDAEQLSHIKYLQFSFAEQLE